MTTAARPLLFAAACLALAGCDRPPPPAADVRPAADAGRSGPGAADAGLPEGSVLLRIPGRDPLAVRVEVAVRPETRARGLMYRTRLEEDAGMLFLFPGPDEHHSFWMRNTLIPLDMIFIDGSMRVVGVVENAVPRTDDPRAVPAPSRFVLEVNGGFARRHGVGPGARVEFRLPDGLEVLPNP